MPGGTRSNVIVTSYTPCRQQLERVQIAARHLPAVIDDQDVVAELLGLAQDLRRQDDGPSARRFAAQHVHDAALQDRIHAGRELVEEDDRRVDHEHLRDLDAPPEAAAQVHHLPVRFGGKIQIVEHAPDPRADLGRRQSVEAREGCEVVAHRQKQFDRGFLNHDRNAPPHVQRCGNHVVAQDARGACGRAGERRQHAQQCGLARAIRAEQAENRPARDVERQPIDRADRRVPATSVALDEISDTNRRVRHIVWLRRHGRHRRIAIGSWRAKPLRGSARDLHGKPVDHSNACPEAGQ